MNPLLLLFVASQIFTFSYSQSTEPQLLARSAAATSPAANLPGAAAKAPKTPKAPKKGKKGKIVTAEFLAFDPPLLELQRFKTDEIPVGISLKKQPRGTVSVYLEAPGIIFSECSLKFTPDNWNKKQMVKVTPVPYLAAAAQARKVQAKFCYSDKNDPELHKTCQNYPIVRKAGKGCRCHIFGDPHYTNFSRQVYHPQGNGVYYLVKSDALTIQEINSPWSRWATVEQIIALRYHDTVFTFNGATKRVQRTSKANGGVRIATIPGVGWNAYMSDGSAMSIQYSSPVGKFYLTTNIMLGQNYDDKVDGLCGKMGKAASVKGQAVPKPAELVKAWKVPQEDNLFRLGAKAASVVAASIKTTDLVVKNKCKIPDLDLNTGDGTNNYGQGEKEEKAFENFRPIENDDKTPEKVLVEAAKAPTKAWLNAAKAKCTAMLTIKKVNAIVNPRPFIDNCVQDCILSQSYDFVEGAKRSYLLAVRDYVRSTKAEPIFNAKSPAAQKLIAVVTQACDAAGLGSTECPNGCSNNGICISSGCACKPGYTGIDCSREVPQAPPADKSYTNDPAPPMVAEQLTEPEIFVDVKKAEKEETEEKEGTEGEEKEAN